MQPIKTQLIAAFPGTGKTYLCNNMSKYATEIEYWQYVEDYRQRQYVKDIREAYGNYKYILLSTDPEGLELLRNEGYKIYLVYPDLSLRNEYLDRYIERNSPSEFIGAFMKYWKPWILELRNVDFCRKIELNTGEYLFDVLAQGMLISEESKIIS